MNRHLFLSSAITLILVLVLLSCSSPEPPINTTTEAAAETVTAAVVQETVPTVTEPVSEPTVKTTPAVAEEVVPLEITPEIIIPEETGETYTVNLIDGGFEFPEITIQAGDTIVWQNVREKSPSKALIIGTYPCAQIKSTIFLPGDSFQWKFEEPLRCTIVDGIFTTQAMKVRVE